MNNFKIEYDGTFLDLVPNQSNEIERINPLFSIENAIAEYTTPISISASDKNVKKIGPDVFFDLHGKCKKKINVKFHDCDGFTYNAILTLDKSTTNRIHPQKGFATGILLIGTSKFYNELSDRKACDLDYESINRIFDFTTFNPFDNSGGYWQHFHDSWNNNLDFVIGTFYNEFEYNIPEISNTLEVGFVNDTLNNQLIPYFPIAIQLRVSYILKRLIVENGWSLDDSEMAGTDWERLFLFNPVIVDYVNITIDSFGLPSFSTKSRIQLFFGKYISPELTCSELFFEICKHYGWVPLIDSNSNNVKLIPLRNSNDGDNKDFTKYASENVENDFSGGAKIISFKNSFPSGDTSIESFDKSKYSEAPAVFKYTDLPTPSAAYDNFIVFVYTENKWYTIDLNQNNQREWYPIGDNIFDAEIPNNTETVESKVTTLPMFRRLHRQTGEPNNYTNYYVFVPVTKQNPKGEWGIRTILWLGMANEFDAASINTSFSYPQISSIRCLHDGTEVSAFSNVFNHINPTNNIDLGIIPYWFKKWNDVSTTSEINEQKIFLPLHILRSLNWTDFIYIDNVPYYIKSYIEQRPYNNFIQAKLQRVFSAPFDQSINAIGEGTYIKLIAEDERIGVPNPNLGILLFDQVFERLYSVKVFSDANMQNPKRVTNLKVKLNISQYDEVNGVETLLYGFNYYLKINNNKIYVGATKIYSEIAGVPDYDYSQNYNTPYFTYKQHYTIDPANKFLLTKINLLPSPDYEIIP